MRTWISVTLAAAFLGWNCHAPSAPELPSRYLPKKNGADGVIVFIHGIGGDADGTWRNATTQAYWPALLAADADRAKDDVYVVSYGSPRFRASANIEEVSQRVLQQLVDADVFAYQRVYFVAHSMGGLITKRLLSNLYRPPTAQQLSRVRAAVLIATPSQGAPVADIAVWLSRNPQLEDMEPHDFNTFLQTLENDWQQLLRQRDRTRGNYPQAYCAYETLPTAGVRVVSGLYAATRCDNTPYPMDYDHWRIVKPPDRSVDPYPWTKARINEADTLAAPEVLAAASLDTLTAQQANALGNFYWNKGYLKEALAAYRRAQALEPDTALYVANEAALLSMVGEVEQASSAYRHAIADEPGVAWFHNELCRNLLRANQVRAAVIQCRAAVRLEPRTAEFQTQLDVALTSSRRASGGG